MVGCNKQFAQKIKMKNQVHEVSVCYDISKHDIAQTDNQIIKLVGAPYILNDSHVFRDMLWDVESPEAAEVMVKKLRKLELHAQIRSDSRPIDWEYR